MSVKDLKEELARMGLSTADCLDRADLAAKLGNARTARGGVGAARSTAAGGQAETNPFASLAFGLQGVFDSVGTSCKGVVSVHTPAKRAGYCACLVVQSLLHGALSSVGLLLWWPGARILSLLSAYPPPIFLSASCRLLTIRHVSTNLSGGRWTS